VGCYQIVVVKKMAQFQFEVAKEKRLEFEVFGNLEKGHGAY
jgi:hypothetical protein